MRLPVGVRGGPQRLRLGADEAIVAVAFELTPVPAIDQAVIAPGLADQRVELHGTSVTDMAICFAPPGATTKTPGLSRSSPV